MDQILLQIIQENIITIGLVLAILKTVAKETPWAMDDKIVEILTGFLKRQKNVKK